LYDDDDNSLFLKFKYINLNKRLRVCTPSAQTKKVLLKYNLIIKFNPKKLF